MINDHDSKSSRSGVGQLILKNQKIEHNQNLPYFQGKFKGNWSQRILVNVNKAQFAKYTQTGTYT